MGPTERSRELTDDMLEIGAKFYPRRYRRFKDLRRYQEACQWASTLQWRDNPYDRYLLRREILHFLESSVVHDSSRNVFTYASRDDIAEEVNHLLDEFSQEADLDVFRWALVAIPVHLVSNARLKS